MRVNSRNSIRRPRSKNKKGCKQWQKHLSLYSIVCPNIIPYMKRIIYILIFSSSLKLSFSEEFKNQPLRILFLGNSYTAAHDLPKLVQEMVEKGGYPKPKVTSNTPGGFTLAQHLHNETSLHLLEDSLDVVVLQEQSTRPALISIVPQERTGFFEGISGLCKRTAEKKGTSPKIIFFQSWARRDP